MVGRIRGRFLQHADDAPWSGQIRITDAERDDVDAGPLLFLHLTIDLGKEIGRDAPESLRPGHGLIQDARSRR